jgi:AcrR family transcriptional regulator
MTLSEHYVLYVSEHGNKPATVAALCKIAGISEADFYKQYTSLNALEDSIWQAWIEETIQTVSSSEAYVNYSVREKYLAFCFGLTQKLLNVRSFVNWRFSSCRMREIYGFTRFKNSVKEHLNALVKEGLESGEIPSRFGIHRIYADAGWIHTIALIKYWLADTSDGFEKTDEFIEKSTNFQMDVITRNGLDSGAELGKFIFQQVWK